MALYRDGTFITDDWHFATSDAALPASGKLVVDKARFLAERAALLARNGELGLVLTAGDTLDGVEPDLARFALIVLHFPRYADGRPYSLARTLRDAHGYRGELRASGDVLRDQVAFLLRSGFDSLDVTHPGTEAALRDGAIVAVRHFYQPASPHVTERDAEGPSWRRRAATA